jgi:hypothetical protein
MEEIKKNYEIKCRVKSDINEHLPTLLKYSKECKHITEMGVRDVVSTWSFLARRPERLVSYDLYTSPNIKEIFRLSNKNNISFQFIQADVLNVDIEETDLLFIDTLHQYGQLKQELAKHASKVRKYIIFHDTAKFGTTDERTGHPGGLIRAIDEFLEADSSWELKEVFTNNNGLTILCKNENETPN